jgi:tetratricopeptide (TPR) repeat protein
MGLLVQDPDRTADTVALYDEFFQKYPESPNRAKAAVVALPALEKANRLPDALKRLEVIIAGFGNNVEAVGLEDCIVSYTNNAEKAGMTLEQLRERMYSFPGLAPDAEIVKARLRMALIDVYEKKIKEEKNEQARNGLKGQVEGLFGQLKRDFDPARMPNYSLVRIGDHLMKSGNPAQAKDYFSQVLKNDDVAFRDKAQFNLAVILGESEAAADREQAIALLDKLLADFATDRGLSEKVTRQKAIVYELGTQWDKASEVCRAYLKNQGWVKYQTEIQYMLALSQDKRKMWGDALATYLQVWSINPGDLLYSTPAWFRFAEIQYKELSKKQEGYEALFRMVKDIGHLEAEEAKGLAKWRVEMDPTTQRRMAERLQVNYIQRAIQTLGAWEAAGGITLINPEQDKKKKK